MLQLYLLLTVLAVVTALILLVGAILLFWRRTRPFGFYALLVEPGAVVGLVVGGFLWWEFLHLIQTSLGPPDEVSNWVAWSLTAVAILWLGLAAIAGTISGFVLATWLWWRFSPEPYRSKLVTGYKRFVTMPPIFRQRWNQRQDAVAANPKRE